MKRIIVIILFLPITQLVNGQLVAKAKCPTFEVDILNGKVNGIKPGFTNDEIKAILPCFTSNEDEGSGKCGGGVFFKDKGITFYTQRDYIEITDKYKGKITPTLIGTSRGSLFKTLGHPKIKDDTWEAFAMQYGTLVLHYTAAGKVRLVQFSSKSTETLSLCQ